jgi:hypothetical protein
MGRLLAEIIIIILVSSISFVLGAIVGSGKRRSNEEDSLIRKEAILPGLHQVNTLTEDGVEWTG